MPSDLRHGLAAVALAATLGGCAYLAFALQRASRFAHRREDVCLEFPGVTVLKPVCGVEPDLYENLCSFCEQEYPTFQIVFGVGDRDDPAIAVIARVMRRFSTRDLVLVVDEPAGVPNPKVANLSNMIGDAKHEILVVADADVRVGPDYLRTVVAGFSRQRVGAVTCLYGGVARGSFASSLAAMQINEQFAPSVLVAAALQPVRFCLGATMAVRRGVLDAIGGLGELAAHLGDDYMLGARVAERGFEVVLSSYVVQSIVCEARIRMLWQHETRWARTVRAQRPLGHAFLFLTYPLPLAALFYALSNDTTLGLGAIGIAATLRIALQRVMRAALHLPTRERPWLIPARDALGLAVWIASFFGRTVRWGQRDFKLGKRGRIELESKR